MQPFEQMIFRLVILDAEILSAVLKHKPVD